MSKHTTYLPSIDGLRAIAVMSVIIYHLNPSFLPGGFLGVDLFFVLSGYLISSLIIKEYQETNNINLVEFYVRRARRLLPAVYTMITIVLIILVLFNKYLLDKSYLDATFGYIYASNWWYIFHKLDYFDTFGLVSPFKHLWSLAIEEQFYMIFPLLFLLLNFGGKKGKIKIQFIYFTLGLILVSLVTHMLLFNFDNINRVYYGTDTRVFSLLIGVIGSVYYPINRLGMRLKPEISKTFSLVSIFSIIAFVVTMFIVSEYSTFLYYGGFFLLSILFLVIIVTAGQQFTLISKVLSIKPFTLIGKLSYSLYLWHFPIIVLTTPVSEIGNPNKLYTVIRLIVIFIFAYCSYTFVETPIRKQGFINYISGILNKIKSYTLKKKRIFMSVCSLTLLLFIMGLFGKSVPILSTAFVAENNINHQTEFVSNIEKSKENVEQAEYKENLKYEDKTYKHVLLIGDSLGIDIGARIVEKYAGTIVDAKVSRQAKESYAISEYYSYLNSSDTAVIFMLGTNGPFTATDLELLFKPFDNADIYFVNTRVPRNWEKSVNNTLIENKSKYKNLTIIDWYSEAINHSEYFLSDGVHLTEQGAQKLVSIIDGSLKHKVETQEMIDIKKAQEEIENKEKEQQENNQNNSTNNN